MPGTGPVRRTRPSLEQARRYIYGQGRDQVLDHGLVEKFLETGPRVARFVEEHTAFGWIPTIWPDYRSDIEGASVGRALFPGPYSPHGLGEAAQFVRPALTTGMAKNPLPLSRVFLGERALPHSIMVNSQGERLANEALAYDHLGKTMREVDPATGSMPNATAWLIFDHHCWTKFGIFGATPGGEVPGYLHRADTLSDLAARIGVDQVGLLRTVDRFNPEAARARDPQFNRGDTMFDRYFGAFYPRLGKFSPDARFPAITARARLAVAAAIGPIVSKLAGRVTRRNDPERVRSMVVGPLARIIRPVLKSPRPSVLGPVDSPPFYALEVEASALGTVGGPRTDALGRALDTDGKVIPGLYAAGNAGGAPTKGFHGGAGGTISLGLVFGYLARREAPSRVDAPQMY